MFKDLRKSWRRILRAAIVSGVGITSTWVWYAHGLKDRANEGKEPIAILVRAVNEVERKPMKRVIWESVEENDFLYPGESVRTSDVSEASIKFIKGGAKIELEPDSLIVIGENAGNLALNFVKGRLFVSETGTTGEDVQITSGTTSLKAADLKKSGGAVAADEVESKEVLLKVASPAPHKAVYLNTLAQEDMTFQIEKLDPSYQVQIEVGPTPKKLKAIAKLSVSGESGLVKTPIKVGPFYWRAVAVSTDPAKPPRRSAIQKNEVIARIPPNLIEPEKDATLAWNPEEPILVFRWSNLARLENMVFELSKTPDFKSPMVLENVESRTNYEYDLKETGTYYWRVRGQLSGAQEQLVSEVYSLKFKREFELLPPHLTKPVQNERLSHQTLIASKLALKWGEVAGVARYRVSVKGNNVDINEDVNIPEFKLAGLQPGAYTWSVVSVDKNDKLSKPSAERKFFVEELPKLQWADSQDSPINYLYTSEKPTLKIEWQKGPEQARSWKVKILEDGAPVEEVKISESLRELKYLSEVEKQGKYQVEVEAYNEDGELVARSSKRVVTVQLLPLLPAPEFADNVPDELVAKNNGSIQVAWEKVDRAAKYVVEVRKQDGTIAKESVSIGLGETLKGMMPGQYKVVVKSIDQTGRRGPASEERPLLVPDRSDARAPKIKAIKVK